MSIRRGTAYNLAGAATPVVLMLVSVPLYLAALGEARYGILAIVWVLTGYFGFLDFGLGRATAFAIARQCDADSERRARTFWTALLVNGAFGLMGALSMLVLAPLLFDRVFQVPAPLAAELQPVLPWLALAIPLLTFEGVLAGALTGRERFLALNIRAAIGTALTQFVPLAFVWIIAPTLQVAVPATILARFLSLALLAAMAFRAVPASFRPHIGDGETLRELTAYGGWISLGAAGSQLVANFDRFLIAGVLGPVATALYTVPYQLVMRGALVSRALSTTMFPRLAREDIDARGELGRRALKANAALMTLPCVAGILVMHPFLALWVGADFAADAAPVGRFLAVTLWLNALAIIAQNMIEADNRPRETVAVLLAQALPFILVAWIGIGWAGLVGVALARNFRSLLDLWLLAWRAGMLGPVLRLLPVPLALLGAAIALSTALPVSDWRFAVAGLILAVASAAWGLAASSELRRFILHDLPTLLKQRRHAG